MASERFDFDLDDPLADILSSNSNDSFYDDDNFVRKNSLKKSSSTDVEKRKNMLFQLESNDVTNKDTTIVQNKEVTKKVTINIKEPSTFSETILQSSHSEYPLKELDLKNEIGISKIQQPTQSLTYTPTKPEVSDSVTKRDDTSDFLDDLGLGESTKKPMIGKSSNVTSKMFDDILGDNVMKKTVLVSSPSRKATPTTSAKISEKIFTVAAKVHDTSDTKVLTANLVADPKPSQPVVNTLPRLESQSHIKLTDTITNKRLKTNIDWLGLGDTQDSVEYDQIKDINDDMALPAWLMGKDNKNSKKATQPKQNVSINIQESKTAAPTNIEDSSTMKQHEPQNAKTDQSNVTQSVEQLFQPVDAKISTISSLGLINAGSCSVAQEGANMYIQEQESQLMVALQLKAQEEKLALLQNRQYEQRRIQMEADRGHKTHLEQMLSKQAEQRRLMQDIIMKNQDIVNQKIRALLGSRSSEDIQETDEAKGSTENMHEENMAAKQLIVIKMTERKQLMQLILTLQENHDREMELMENSFRRQLSLANSTVTEMEDRLKEDNARLYKFDEAKCLWMQRQCQDYVSRADEQLAMLAARHRHDLESLQQHQAAAVEVLQQHHTTLLDNIRGTLEREQRVINDATSYSTTLSALKVDIEANTGTCAAVLGELRNTLMNQQQQSITSLTKKEELLSGLLGSLNREKEMFFKERADSMETNKLLETRLRQMTQMIEEENNNIKQRRMELEFEKVEFKKQTEFAKSILEKQQEEIKTVREKIDIEYLETQRKLDEEKKQADKDSSILNTEKRKLESEKKEMEKIKNDLNNQLEEISNEKIQLSREKQKLHTDELENITRSNELELLTRRAMEKQMQADKKMSEADHIVRKYEEQLRKIQEQVLSLNAREKLIARDKTALSRERLHLYNERRGLESRPQCSLCRASQSVQPSNNDVFGDTVKEMYAGSHDEVYNWNSSVTRDVNFANDVASLERQMEQFFVGTNVISMDGERGNRDHNNDLEEPEENQRHLGDSASNAKEIVDPRHLMLKLDVRQVIDHLKRSAEAKPSDPK